MKIILRAEAIKLGLKKYFTGKPCKHGHVAERYTGVRICIECLAMQAADPVIAAQKRAQQREHEKTPGRRAYQSARKSSPKYKKWAAAYQAGEQGRAVKAKYRASAKGKAKQNEYNARIESRAARTAWRLSSEGRAQIAVWRASPEGRAVICANVNKRRALHRDRTVPLTKDEKARVTVLYERAVRLTDETGIEHHVDHILPMSHGGLHHPDNLQVVTQAYNLAKKNLTEEEFTESLRTGVRVRLDTHNDVS